MLSQIYGVATNIIMSFNFEPCLSLCHSISSPVYHYVIQFPALFKIVT